MTGRLIEFRILGAADPVPLIYRVPNVSMHLLEIAYGNQYRVTPYTGPTRNVRITGVLESVAFREALGYKGYAKLKKRETFINLELQLS